MGGVSAGMVDSTMVSAANPAASAWAGSTGLSWGTKVRETQDTAWSGAASFPDISLIMPLPLNLQFSAFLSNRSRMNTVDTLVVENGIGTIDWTGGSAESYIGVTTSVSEHLAFSLGGKCFFGSAYGKAVTSHDSPSCMEPASSIFRDDLSFSPSWGMFVGAFVNTDYLSAGASLVTDRSGNLDIQRDYEGNSSADTVYHYRVPGELHAGISSSVIPRFVIGLDFFSRKSLTLLEKTTGDGSYLASGFEFNPGHGFRIRGGYRVIDGLWRDGASRYSGGAGYVIASGKASFDIGVGYETWGTDQSETVVFASIRASENWLGR
jgi:hypothetical protein